MSMLRTARQFMTLVAVMVATIALAAGATPAQALDVQRADIKAFITRMADAHGFDQDKLRAWLAVAQSQQSIIDAMDRPAEKAKLWYEYRATFLTERRIREGVEFWTAHRAELDQASSYTGVAPEYLIGILGVETYYGRLTGRYRVLDSLSTLAFDYPPRAKFFQNELEQFFLLTREAAVDPLTATGSYAGAMGAPQFMPSTYRRYAVDADKDGHIDLWTNWPDVLASIGNYLEQFGWIKGEPVLSAAALAMTSPAASSTSATAADPAKAPPANQTGRKLALGDTVGSLTAQGFVFDTTQPAQAPALPIAVDEADGVHWRIGYNNFYVITRYNHSTLYAMAVYELAAAVKTRILANALQPGNSPGP
jgi:membrane-bound lytic murein transglycosylase B